MNVAELVLLHRTAPGIDRASDRGGFGATATGAAQGRVETAPQFDLDWLFVRHCATSSALAVYARQLKLISRADTHLTASHHQRKAHACVRVCRVGYAVELRYEAGVDVEDAGLNVATDTKSVIILAYSFTSRRSLRKVLSTCRY